MHNNMRDCFEWQLAARLQQTGFLQPTLAPPTLHLFPDFSGLGRSLVESVTGRMETQSFMMALQKPKGDIHVLYSFSVSFFFWQYFYEAFLTHETNSSITQTNTQWPQVLIIHSSNGSNFSMVYM